MVHPLTSAHSPREPTPLAARREALQARRRERFFARATPAERAALESRGSALRHSAVEAVLQNLKLTAQALGEQPGEAVLTRRLDDHLARVATLRPPIDAFFGRERLGGTALRLIFSEEHWTVRRALERLARLDSGRAGEIPALVDDLMGALRRIDSAVRERRVSPGALALEALSVLRPAADAQGIAIRTAAGLESLPALHLDRDLALDALTETLRNAIHHAFPPSHRGERRIALGGSADARGVEIRVSDTGCGMPPSPGGGGETHGTDLVRRLMQSMGGEARWKSSTAAGTSVALRWPLQPAGAAKE